MAEPYEGPPPTRFEHNRELLRAGECGELAEAAYLAAVEQDPRLETMQIVTDAHRRASFARAVPSWSSMETPLHRVFLPSHTENVRPALVALMADILAIPGALEHYAGNMGIAAEDVTLEGLYAYALEHEFGHVSDYFDNHHHQREFVERDRAEKLALPISDKSVSVLVSPRSREHLMIEKHWEQVAAEQGVETFEELYAKQFEAYKSMTAERNADRFAAAVMAAHPELARPVPIVGS